MEVMVRGTFKKNSEIVEFSFSRNKNPGKVLLQSRKIIQKLFQGGII